MPSSAIRSLSYDDRTATLFVTFVDGDLYAYFDVREPVFQAFGKATSKGRFFAARIRDRYRYRRIGGPGDEPSLGPSSGDPASPPPAGARR